MNSKVSIVVTSMNRKNHLKRCLGSVFNNNYRNFEIILVDNGSTDGSVQYIKSLKGKVRSIFNKKNLGLIKATNQGVFNSNGDFILFLAHDNIIDKDMIKHMLELFKIDKNIGIITPKIFYQQDPNRIWFYGVKINFFTSKFYFINKDIVDKKGKIDYDLQVQSIHNCFMVKKEVFDKIGYFDKTYFSDHSEFDLCMRASKFYKIFISGKAICYNDASVLSVQNRDKSHYGFTSNRRVYHLTRDRAVIIKRYANKFQRLVFISLFYPASFFYRGFILLKFGEISYLKAHFLGTIAGINYFLFNQLKGMKNEDRWKNLY
jgi:GT2 family glycosyltransferase